MSASKRHEALNGVLLRRTRLKRPFYKVFFYQRQYRNHGKNLGVTAILS